jgi:hypothetical protein
LCIAVLCIAVLCIAVLCIAGGAAREARRGKEPLPRTAG